MTDLRLATRRVLRQHLALIHEELHGPNPSPQGLDRRSRDEVVLKCHEDARRIVAELEGIEREIVLDEWYDLVRKKMERARHETRPDGAQRP